MPRKTFEQITLGELLRRISGANGQPELNICPEFQRGTTTKGVWSVSGQKELMKTVSSNMPWGAITIVQRRGALQWDILDGGNRVRTIRDYVANNKFAAEIGGDPRLRKFRSLTEREQSDLKNIILTLEKVVILPDDPDDIIARMYCALNANGMTLQLGELLKAWGWRNTIPVINLAKELMEEDREFRDALEENAVAGAAGDDAVLAIRRRWSAVIGKAPTKRTRSNTLAYLVRLILSSVHSDANILNSNYKELAGKLTSRQLLPEQERKVFHDINQLLTFLDGVSKTVWWQLWRHNGGCIDLRHIAAAWNHIVTEQMNSDAMDMFERFYEQMRDGAALADFERLIKDDLPPQGWVRPGAELQLRHILDWEAENGRNGYIASLIGAVGQQLREHF